MALDLRRDPGDDSDEVPQAAYTRGIEVASTWAAEFDIALTPAVLEDLARKITAQVFAGPDRSVLFPDGRPAGIPARGEP